MLVCSHREASYNTHHTSIFTLHTFSFIFHLTSQHPCVREIDCKCSEHTHLHEEMDRHNISVNLSEL